MTAFEKAWGVVKMPVFTGDNSPFLHADEGRYEYFMPNFIEGRSEAHNDNNPRLWESKHFDAQGYANYMDEEDDDELGPYLQLILFQLANEARGHGLSRERLMEMIDELRAFEGGDYPIRVTNIEGDTTDYWNKLVDEGVIDSASQRPWVATTPDGKIIPKIG